MEPNIRYHFHHSLQFIPNLRQINSDYNTPFYLKYILISSYFIWLCLPYGFFLQVSPPNPVWISLKPTPAHQSAVLMTPVTCLLLTVPVNTTSASKRKGKNPLETYLKDED
jgi:hypothetical protein